MNKIDSIKRKIEHIKSIIVEIETELLTLSKEQEAKSNKPQQTTEILPSDEELRSEYNRLYEAFITSNSNAVDVFIKSKTKTYLKAFCKANNLPVDTTKVSKEGIVDIVKQWMAQRKVITKKAT